MERDRLLGTMDAKVWTDEFMATRARLGDKEFDHAMMLAWFANAIMAGFDEANRCAQRALDAAQARVKELERERDVWRDKTKHLGKVSSDLQAQLAAMTESRDAWRLAQECSEKAYMSLATQIPSERYDYDPVNLALLDGAKEQERIGRKQIADLQAQLRQVEGERDHAKKMEAVQKEVADNQTWHVQKLKGWRDTVTLALQRPGGARFEDVPGHIKALVKEHDTLQQLVSALPVVDVQEVSVWLSPDESGWLVSKRPAFPAGLYWAKFRTQAEADSFRALLAYRATLVAQDSPHPTEEAR